MPPRYRIVYTSKFDFETARASLLAHINTLRELNVNGPVGEISKLLNVVAKLSELQTAMELVTHKCPLSGGGE